MSKANDKTIAKLRKRCADLERENVRLAIDHKLFYEVMGAKETACKIADIANETATFSPERAKRIEELRAIGKPK